LEAHAAKGDDRAKLLAYTDDVKHSRDVGEFGDKIAKGSEQ
jgi:hypothetical protein